MSFKTKNEQMTYRLGSLSQQSHSDTTKHLPRPPGNADSATMPSLNLWKQCRRGCQTVSHGMLVLAYRAALPEDEEESWKTRSKHAQCVYTAHVVVPLTMNMIKHLCFTVSETVKVSEAKEGVQSRNCLTCKRTPTSLGSEFSEFF